MDERKDWSVRNLINWVPIHNFCQRTQWQKEELGSEKAARTLAEAYTGLIGTEWDAKRELFFAARGQMQPHSPTFPG